MGLVGVPFVLRRGDRHSPGVFVRAHLLPQCTSSAQAPKAGHRDPPSADRARLSMSPPPGLLRGVAVSLLSPEGSSAALHTGTQAGPEARPLLDGWAEVCLGAGDVLGAVPGPHRPPQQLSPNCLINSVINRLIGTSASNPP